jgi:hypothetical protein
MKKFKIFLWLFLFGSIWGINEVFLGEFLYKNEIQNSSVMLTLIALFLLSVARGMFNKAGASSLIGVFAVLFRLANTAPSYCHLLGIFLLGFTFDIFSTLWIRNEDKTPYRWAAAGMLSAFGNNALFAVLITYVFRYEYWVVGGISKVTQHIFISGGMITLFAAFVVPLGFYAGRNGGILVTRRPHWSYASTIFVSIVLWTAALLLS